AIEAVWKYIRAHGDNCYFTKRPLEMDDTKSPWYCVFDHLIPLDPRTIVLTSALINTIKSALSEDEFWYMIEQLDDFKRKGKKIKKINLAHWRQHVFASKKEGLPYKKRPIWPHPQDKKCDICGRPVFSLQSKYCLRCSHFNWRMEHKGFSPEAMEAVREYLRANGYVCALTGLPLEMKDDRSPWYCVFDYLVPGDRSSLIVTCALFCEMKSDLTIEEFWYYIRQLADHKRYGTPFRKRTPHHWCRLTAQELRMKNLRD
ncbi:MAG: hypothetical protein KGJ95_09415, partial [Candidatus Omnitrophica bacterium]|nr:hypothetical protein [Candidatus Omnitrophota bacterium]